MIRKKLAGGERQLRSGPGNAEGSTSSSVDSYQKQRCLLNSALQQHEQPQLKIWKIIIRRFALEHAERFMRHLRRGQYPCGILHRDVRERSKTGEAPASCSYYRSRELRASRKRKAKLPRTQQVKGLATIRFFPEMKQHKK